MWQGSEEGNGISTESIHGATKDPRRSSDPNLLVYQASLVAQAVKNLPVTQESWVQTLGQEDPWRIATHSSILAERIPGTEEPGGLQLVGLPRVRHH